MKGLLLFSIVLFCGITIFAQSSTAVDLFNKDEQVIIELPGYLPNNSEIEAAVLHNNGPFVTHPGGGPGGADGSVLQNSSLQMNILGFGFVSPSFRLADDFTVPVNEQWTIDSIKVFGYLTGSTLVSTFTALNYRILQGTEPGGAPVVFGDVTTNRMIATRWSGAYRYTETATGTTRPLMEVVASGGAVLLGGTYMVDYQATGGSFAPPITITGTAITGNAFQSGNNGVGYSPLVDSLAGGPPPSRQGMPFIIYGTSIVIPVELTSFTASVTDKNVTLNWTTATEVNNQGFEVQKQVNGEYMTIGFVNGNGTTTEAQSYSYVDRNLSAGSYNYRLKQVDFDGTFEYSPVVEVDVTLPAIYSLAQNYPNPFNPSTKIDFSLAVDSKVNLKVFNILGQQVAELVNGNITAGIHEINFDATSLNSGVYFYTIEAIGIDGTNFNKTMKMILTK